MRARGWWSGLALVAVLLAGCAAGQGGGAPLPTVVLGSGAAPAAAPATRAARPTGGVVASAQVAPAQQATLLAANTGRVVALPRAEGERVAAGELLVALDEQASAAQRAQAQAALDLALANQALLTAGPTAESVRQAQAAVAGAQAQLAALQAGPRPEQVTQAEAALVAAQATLAALLAGPDALALEGARLGVAQAKNALWAAQSERDVVCGSRALAEAQCDAAQARALVAETGVSLAENQLAQLEQGAAADVLAQAQQAVRSAAAQLALARAPITEHELAAAQAQVEAAQAALDALQAAPQPAQLAAAQAQVDGARAQLAAAEAQSATLAVNAPFDGALVTLPVYVGQWVMAGQAVATVAAVDALVVETTDLSELNVPGIGVGQPVMVTIEALALDAPGRVSAIAPLAETLGGDVVYRVTITLDAPPAGLRAGMSAEVTF